MYGSYWNSAWRVIDALLLAMIIKHSILEAVNLVRNIPST